MLLTVRCQSLWRTTEKNNELLFQNAKAYQQSVQDNRKQMHFFVLDSFAKTDLESKMFQVGLCYYKGDTHYAVDPNNMVLNCVGPHICGSFLTDVGICFGQFLKIEIS